MFKILKKLSEKDRNFWGSDFVAIYGVDNTKVDFAIRKVDYSGGGGGFAYVILERLGFSRPAWCKS